VRVQRAPRHERSAAVVDAAEPVKEVRGADHAALGGQSSGFWVLGLGFGSRVLDLGV